MICVPIQASSIQELKRKIKKVPNSIQLIEIWVDFLPVEIPTSQILKLTNRKVVIVNKPRKEKGKWKGTEQSRINRLIEFIKAGADYVDVGIATDPTLIKKVTSAAKNRRTKIIISYHDFKKTPSFNMLYQTVKKAEKLHADVIKIATHVSKKDDNFKLLSLLSLYAEKKKIITIGMGSKGTISRVAGLALGNHINYISMDNSKKTAPGQISLKQYSTLKDIINFS